MIPHIVAAIGGFLIGSLKRTQGQLLKDGGEVYYNLYENQKIKKAYVSIRIRYEIERNKNFEWQFKSIDEKPFQELKNQKLIGVKGISTSNYNVSDWFVNRDCLIVMPFDKFLELNNTEQIKYDDPYYLTKDGLRAFYRLYNTDRENQYQYQSVLDNIFKYIQKEFVLEAQTKKNGRIYFSISELYNVYHSSAFVRYISNKKRIDSPEDLARLTIQYINSGDISSSDYSNYFDASTNASISEDDILDTIKKGIVSAGLIFEDESEWVLNDEILHIPTNSQVFFKKLDYLNEMETYQNLIQKFSLQEKYKIYFVQSKYLSKLQSQRFGAKEKKYKNKLEGIQKRVDKKIGNALVEIENEMLEIFEYHFSEAIKNDESLHPEYFKDEDGNNLGNNILAIPEVNDLYLSFLRYLTDEYDATTMKVIETKNRYFINDFANKVTRYINQLGEDTFGKDFDFRDEYGYKYPYYSITDKIKYAFKQIPFTELSESIKFKVGSDLYRGYAKSEIMLKAGGQL